MDEKNIKNASRMPGIFFLSAVLIISFLNGCNSGSTRKNKKLSDPQAEVQKKYELKYLDSEQCRVLLAPLEIANIRYVPKTNIIYLSGTQDEMKKASSVIDVIDSPEKYHVENLGSASIAGTLPPNGQIEARLGNLDIGTFNEPPVKDTKSRAIIDIHKDSVLAFMPAEFRDSLLKIIENKNFAVDSQKAELVQNEPNEYLKEKIAAAPSGTAINLTETGLRSDALVAKTENRQEDDKTNTDNINKNQSVNVVALSEMADPKDVNTESHAIEFSSQVHDKNDLPKTVRIQFKSSNTASENATAKTITDKAVPENADDILELTLPETLTLMQLLDLTGKHLKLNYVYDTKLISNQPIALKLHGNLQGQMKIRDLYALLETVLDFMGLAMIRQQDNLVAIVPIDRALLTQPELVGSDSEALNIGDTVAIRVFEIKYVNISDVTTLLQNMKLSLAVTALENNNLLFVTCYAGKMNRIEQLVNMIDQPGRAVECRFRSLYYTLAPSLVVKIRTLAEELKGITVVSPSPSSPAPKPAIALTGQPPVAAAQPTIKKSVYLDFDERTNRILMIGLEEELSLVEEIIDVLDVAQTDSRSAGIYSIKYLDAAQALEKLQKLDIIKSSGGSAGTQSRPENTSQGEQPLVIVLESTNQLLVRAAPDQHARIREFLNYIDVNPGSTRTLFAYEMINIKAAAAKKVLEELDLTGSRTITEAAPATAIAPAGPNEPPIPRFNVVKEGSPESKPQVVLNESTNALLINATKEQHNRIANILNYIDRKASGEELTYQIYPIENSSPEYIYSLLNQLITETKKDKDDKIIKEPRTDEKIIIVPDSNTFSLIVYASRKNQEWIKELTNILDKRRPQVLIDVTLVEITRTDTFEYDLDIVANAKNSAVGNIIVNPIQSVTSGSVLEGGYNLRDTDGNPTGQSKVFYSDDKVQALLTAMQQKNYGRVLAKPKILVDDGQEGQIITTDITSYVEETVQIPQTGSPITTRDFASIEASIELLISPHISEGDLLRLAVSLSRDDFGSRPLSGAPPDITSSKVNTTVFVPDNSTVILGGLVKLNQNKSGSKIPILGDLPFIGALFRSIGKSDVEKKMYVFLKANIVRPYNESKLEDLKKISEKYHDAFEESESEFQNSDYWPGLKPTPMQPEKVLQNYE